MKEKDKNNVTSIEKARNEAEQIEKRLHDSLEYRFSELIHAHHAYQHALEDTDRNFWAEAIRYWADSMVYTLGQIHSWDFES